MTQATTQRQYPQYEVNGRIMRDYDDALMYYRVYGGVMMEKIDAMTPAHVLMSDHSMS